MISFPRSLSFMYIYTGPWDRHTLLIYPQVIKEEEENTCDHERTGEMTEEITRHLPQLHHFTIRQVLTY